MRRENVYFMVIRCTSKTGENGWKSGKNSTFGQNVQTQELEMKIDKQILCRKRVAWEDVIWYNGKCTYGATLMKLKRQNM